MADPTDRKYFDWLVSQIEINSTKTYNDLLDRLHNTEFIWVIPNDDNRVKDGLDLRTEFCDDTVGWQTEDIMQLPIMTGKGASVLEVLIGLSRRVAFTCGGEAPWWAWQLMGNVGLYKFSDPLGRMKAERLDDILEALIWRTYQRDGEGGFFPLNDPKEDQTKVEIWYQMNQYAMEIQEV
jgi:hypothetical protein